MNGEFSTDVPKKRARLGIMNKIVLGVLILAIAFVFYVVLDANKYSAQVRIIEGEGKVGVNPTTESLDFGDLSRGTSAVRQVDLQNDTVMPIYVFVWKVGRISDLVEINDSSFRLDPKSGTKVSFSTYVPASATVGDVYKGRVYIFRIPTFGL